MHVGGRIPPAMARPYKANGRPCTMTTAIRIGHGVIVVDGAVAFRSSYLNMLRMRWDSEHYDEASAAILVYDTAGIEYRARYLGRFPAGNHPAIDHWTLTTGPTTYTGYCDPSGTFLPTDCAPAPGA